MAETEDAKYSEPKYAKPKSDKPAWYPASIDKRLIPSTKKFLEEYSGIPPSQQSEHVHEIREKAFAIRTYPSIGFGVWLIPYIGLTPVYSKVLQRLKDGEYMIDVGCFTGGDFRRCAYDGAPTDNMVGMDIADFWEVGYELYRDKEKFKGRFVEADIMAVETEQCPAEIQALKGKVSIIHICQVLHQWNWEDQVAACKKLAYFSKTGTYVLGFQIGRSEGKELEMKSFNNAKIWRHGPDSFIKMWDVVGKETGTKWKTEAWMREWAFVGLDDSDVKFMEPGDYPMEFVVERVE